jgi:predicted nucleic acid-binding protein
MIVRDTSGLLAALDASEPHHAAAAAVLRGSSDAKLLSPFVLAELDYLLGVRVSRRAADALLAEVAAGAYQLEPFDAADIASAGAITTRFAHLAVGLADASIVVLADRHAVRDVLTLDERHFRALRDGRGRAFRVLPADAV